MARRGGAQNLIRAISRLPWWGAVLLAGSMYLVLNNAAPDSAEGTLATVVTPAFRLFGIALLLLCIVGFIAGLLRRIHQSNLFARQVSLETVRGLHWRNFEHLIVEAFRRNGYNAQISERGPDGGVDLRLKKSGKVYLVQCKQWRSRQVGVQPIRELAGVVATTGAAGGKFVCSGSYTAEARAFASRAGIELIDGDRLSTIMQFDNGALRAEGPDTFCPRCGGGLVERVARRGPNAGKKFFGCSGYPRCRYTRATA